MNVLDMIQPQNNLSILLSSKSNEWYTPSLYVEAARKLMNGIDLDPASCREANLVVRASRFYTKEENGLAKEWYGRIWLNPPYGVTNGHSNQGIWTRRLIAEYKRGKVTQAILLVNAKTDTRWFESLWQYPICFTHGRINFYVSKQVTQIGNTNGSCFIYLGPHEHKFIDVFSQFGTIAKRISQPKVQYVNLSLWETLK